MIQTLKALTGPTAKKLATGALFAAPLLAGPAGVLGDEIKTLTGRATDEDYAMERVLRQPTPMQTAMRAKRLQETMSWNQAMLAQRFPNIYARLLAGRELPDGAVVYGGQPNYGNVERAALGMSTGAFGPPPQSGLGGIIGP